MTSATASADNHQKRTWMSPHARRRTRGVISRGAAGSADDDASDAAAGVDAEAVMVSSVGDTHRQDKRTPAPWQRGHCHFTGSSAISQIGHRPGFGERISSCIGQV